ncbi:helix-turn-helix domain-containing protein [Poriferisphaera sp. WC338]|uniref:helix-turn-helix domain-containing protein n=1 Tax=Poriferisphaera sp. WC338 TaxID=3425129 RepID=UPI003D81622F
MIETRYLTHRSAAIYLETSERTLHMLKANRELPYIKLGGRIRYDKHDLDAYMKSNKRIGAR